MAEYTSTTIEKLLERIQKEEIVLPAMQRNFVWPEAKICSLFESLTRDYPIGTCLFWKVDKPVFNEYVFNTFIKDYDEQKGKMQRGDRATSDLDTHHAVLDGQQRITSLYLGLKGKYRSRRKGAPRDRDSSYYDRYLCLNVLHFPDPTDGEYQFEFKEENQIDTIFLNNETNEHECWLKVSSLCDSSFDGFLHMFDKQPSYPDILSHDVLLKTKDIIDDLVHAITVKNNISYYCAEDMDLTQVVDIFVRVNSGGQKLSAPDLMLSVATGERENQDVHVLMDAAVERINDAPNNTETGFKADKELVLTAGLMFTGADNLSLQKKESYSRERINIILDNWDRIVDSLYYSSKYIEFLGFEGKRLTSKNIILPVAYYFYKNSLDDSHCSSPSKTAKNDRVLIRQWMLRAMVNSVFSDSTRITLLSIRNLIEKSTIGYFPLEELMKANIRKPLTIGQSQIEEMLDLRYGDVRVVPLLRELAKDYSVTVYDTDHIWPKSKLQSIRALRSLLPGLTDKEREKYKDLCHGLANLQLLQPLPNSVKNDRFFDEWVSTEHPDPADRYYDDNCIPHMDSYEFSVFPEFVSKRRAILAAKISEAFPASFDAILARNNLSR